MQCAQIPFEECKMQQLDVRCWINKLDNELKTNKQPDVEIDMVEACELANSRTFSRLLIART